MRTCPIRRRVLTGLAALTASCCLDPFALAANGRHIPILMFHKVSDRPHSPEDITSEQLEKLFTYIWSLGFAPLNMSDILRNKVDEVLPKGRRAVGITVDDAHPSVIYARGEHSQTLNRRSFLEIFTESAALAGLAPRASFFLSGTSYFGGNRGPGHVLDLLAPTPGIELGYHTRRHPRMKGFGYDQTRQVIEEQIEDFRRREVADRIVRILAYPYGLPPEPDGLRALADLGFYGGLLAFPGLGEAKYTTRPPQCLYGSGGLITHPFAVPRVNIGALIYAPRGGFADIDPIGDFRKDVGPLDEIYVAGG